MKKPIRNLLSTAVLSLVLLACGVLSTPPTPTPRPATAPTSTPTQPPVPTTPPATPTPTSTPLALITPTPAPVLPIRFAVIGDYGSSGPALQAVADLIKSWDVDFIITTGDNNYPSGWAATIDRNIGQYFHEFIYPYDGEYGPGSDVNRFFPSLGNHDWDTPLAGPYLDYFTLPGNERYYDFVWGPVHFFALDSDSREPDGIASSSVQATWLKEALAASTAPWKIVYMHHPPYSSATHGSTPPLQWPYREWGASAVLAGHDHVYERILLDGFPYFTNGLGGSPHRYTFDENNLPGSQVRYRELHGAMLVEADTQQITLQFININGEVIDSYTISTSATD